MKRIFYVGIILIAIISNLNAQKLDKLMKDLTKSYYDILGNKVYESYVCENKHKLPYNLLKAGYYLYELKGINGTAVSGRFMVE